MDPIEDVIVRAARGEEPFAFQLTTVDGSRAIAADLLARHADLRREFRDNADALAAELRVAARNAQHRPTAPAPRPQSALDVLEHLLANGDPATIVACATPAGALEQATAILAVDESARRDFAAPAALAGYLRSLASGQRSDAERALAEPGKAPRLSLMPTAAARLHEATAATPPAGRPPAAVALPAPIAATSPPPAPAAVPVSAAIEKPPMPTKPLATRQPAFDVDDDLSPEEQRAVERTVQRAAAEGAIWALRSPWLANASKG